MLKSKLIKIMDSIKSIISHDKYEVEPPVKFFNWLRKNRIKIENELKSIIETRDEINKQYFKQLRDEKALDSQHSATPLKILDKVKYKEITESFSDRFAGVDALLAEESELKLDKYSEDTPEGVPMRFLNILADNDLLKS